MDHIGIYTWTFVIILFIMVKIRKNLNIQLTGQAK